MILMFLFHGETPPHPCDGIIFSAINFFWILLLCSATTNFVLMPGREILFFLFFRESAITMQNLTSIIFHPFFTIETIFPSYFCKYNLKHFCMGRFFYSKKKLVFWAISFLKVLKENIITSVTEKRTTETNLITFLKRDKVIRLPNSIIILVIYSLG